MNYNTVLTLPEYRAAVYFGLVMRIRGMIRTFLIIFALSIVYLIAGQLGLIPYSMLLNYIVTAYLVFLLFQFGRVELSIYRYSKNPDCLLGVEIIYRFTDTVFTVEIPSRREKNRYDVNGIASVFEESANFMIYMNAAQTFLLPKSSLTSSDVSELRAFFAAHLKERFASRFFDKSTAAFGKKRGFFR